MKKSPVKKTAKSKPKSKSKSEIKHINLALQGGGAHGAFTWGVLDRLLEEDKLEIEGIVGTSAGAVNAAITAYGLEIGGRQKAKELLDRFWKINAEIGTTSPYQPTLMDKLFGAKGTLEYSPCWKTVDLLSRIFSPYEWNQGGINLFKDVIEELIDFPRLRQAKTIKLFVCATNVLTGRLKVFENHEMTPDMIMGSACLPSLFHAAEINGEYFWDGGFMGNPPIYPVIYNTQCQDVLIVQIMPTNIPEVPKDAHDIFDRINTLSFNSSLMREMRAINFVTKLIKKGELDPRKYKLTFIHTIDAEEEMSQLAPSSKMNLDIEFLMYLFELGRAKTDEFLKNHFDEIGVQSSTDIAAKFL